MGDMRYGYGEVEKWVWWGGLKEWQGWVIIDVVGMSGAAGETS